MEQVACEIDARPRWSPPAAPRSQAASGRCYQGIVLHGAEIGRTIGFPTANIALQGARPRVGIYAAQVRLNNGHNQPGVTYFGSRPTVDGQHELLEVFIFDFADEIYGAHLSVELVAFIRPDVKFPDLRAMTRQIAEDCKAATCILRR